MTALPYLLIPLILILLTLISSFVCFMTVFYSRNKPSNEEFPIPKGEIYEVFREDMIGWMKQFKSLPHTDVEITSYDGLKLRGKYFEYEKGAPAEILFHGYRGSSYRDLCGGVYRCFELGRNALVVDQRAHGESEGHLITFGARESRDCIEWINFYVNNIDADAKIIITGISMGAATVMITAGKALPKNVVGVLADCGYTSAKDIIKKVIRDIKLPSRLIYPLVRLGAILYGGFDPSKVSPKEALKGASLPVIFLHGDTDLFVPCSMSEENFAVCASEKKELVKIEGAGHGLAFPKDRDKYFQALRDFFDPILK